MANTICTSFKDELTDAIHDLNTDVLKVALFTSSWTGSAATTAYSTTNEASGTGYTAGGATLTVTKSTSGTTVLFDFADVSWTTATIADFQYALVYNSSKANRACFFYDFGSAQSVSSGTATIQWPAADASNAAFRL